MFSERQIGFLHLLIHSSWNQRSFERFKITFLFTFQLNRINFHCSILSQNHSSKKNNSRIATTGTKCYLESFQLEFNFHCSLTQSASIPMHTEFRMLEYFWPNYLQTTIKFHCALQMKALWTDKLNDRINSTQLNDSTQLGFDVNPLHC